MNCVVNYLKLVDEDDDEATFKRTFSIFQNTDVFWKEIPRSITADEILSINSTYYRKKITL